MTTAFRLIAKALRLETPPRIVMFGLLNRLNFLFRTGNRRYEFERLYLEEFDPWRYHSSPYEQAKYRHTLDRILELRRGSGAVLEIGCSLGVFSGLLADHFGEVTSIDISNEALLSARAYNAGRQNLSFRRCDVQSAYLRRQADVITCAEVLYYLREQDVERVCDSLERNLAAEGIIMYVSGLEGPSSAFHCNAWPERLAARFEVLFRERVDDVERPYDLIAFSRRKPA